MNVYSFILENREVFKFLYALVIIAISILIVTKSHKLFQLSSHNGIRYFRNAFFFFGLGFASRYFLKFLFEIPGLKSLNMIPFLLFEFFMVMAGFFLLYSLIWKKFETGKDVRSSLFNPRIIVFYLITLLILIVNLLWPKPHLVFLSQILVFLIASVIAYVNCMRKGNSKFPRLYFSAMLLALFGWILNTLAALLFQWDPIVIVNIYLFNMVAFLIFLYGVVGATRS